jgi:hypothetical protein
VVAVARAQLAGGASMNDVIAFLRAKGFSQIQLMGLAFSGQLFSGLIYAASCRFRYSLWTSCGVL